MYKSIAEKVALGSGRCVRLRPFGGATTGHYRAGRSPPMVKVSAFDHVVRGLLAGVLFNNAPVAKR